MKRWVIRKIQREMGKRNLTIVRPGIPHHRDELDLLPLLTERLALDPVNAQVVQIGANDGGIGDPIYPLVKRTGWKALLVEPQAYAVEKLRQRYADMPHVIIDQCAIGAADGEATFYAVDPAAGLPEIFGHLASFEKSMLVRQMKHVRGADKHILTYRVHTKTLKTLLTEQAIDHVHLLQVDAEGYDYEILKMAFAANIRPDIINFESWHLRFDQKQELGKMFHEAGYDHLNLSRDTIAVRENVLTSP